MNARRMGMVLAAAVAIALLSSVLATDGPVNNGTKVWQVRYHEKQPNKNGDIALRLKITGSGSKLSAVLTRYNGVSKADPATGKKYYVQRPVGGQITMNGTTTTKGHKNRMRELFELTGNYMEGTTTHTVTIKGFHHNGKSRKDEDDDWLCLRVNDKTPDGLRAAKAPVNCDEEPPDEDNLTEEDPAPEPPEYDAEELP